MVSLVHLICCDAHWVQEMSQEQNVGLSTTATGDARPQEEGAVCIGQ